MGEQKKQSGRAAPEQLRYANMLFYGAWIGLTVMVITYLLYITGAIAPHVPLKMVPRLWTLPAHEYVRLANLPTGWGWVGLLGQGDMLNFVGIVILACMTMICYVPLIPTYFKRGEKAFGCMAVLEILILLVAASGILGGGGH